MSIRRRRPVKSGFLGDGGDIALGRVTEADNEEVSESRPGPASHSGGGDVADLLSATVVWIE